MHVAEPTPHAVASARRPVASSVETGRRVHRVLREPRRHRRALRAENEERLPHVRQRLGCVLRGHCVVLGGVVGVGRHGAPDELPLGAHRRPARGSGFVAVVAPVARLRAREHVFAGSVGGELVEDRRRLVEPGGDVLVRDVCRDADVGHLRGQGVQVVADRVRERELVAQPLAERVGVRVECDPCRGSTVREERHAHADTEARRVHARRRQIVERPWQPEASRSARRRGARGRRRAPRALRRRARRRQLRQ